MTRFLLLPIFLCLGACASLPHPFLYEIEKDGKKSSILGTMHVGFGASELPEFVHERIKGAKTFASEAGEWMDTERAKEFIEAEIQLDRLTMWENRLLKKKLSEKVSPEIWQGIVKVLGSRFPEDQLEAMPPRLCSRLLEQFNPRMVKMFGPMAFGFAENRLDLEIYRRMKKRNVFQVRLDPNEGINKQCIDALYLDTIVTHFTQSDTLKENMAKYMYQAYESGDEAAILKFEHEFYQADVDQCLLADRNALWADAIDRLNDEHSPVFVAVGVGHLVGDRSLLKILLGKGYAVRRIEK